ncbi:MarR family winged helix-turn-helix transcriptional regulator [uncultured Friedmanniella sp.]|uniref:MarR family winged helix-turn-helix transcriptional regulator n=1 Tax=uncultured Friedmanniella sp. TaxID=335381 RepID=UPI0035CC5956
MTTTSDRREATAGLLDTLSRLIRTSRAVTHRQTTAFDLAGTPIGILKALAEGDARPGDVAVRLQIAPSVVSRAVVPLEQARLVERRLDPADARAWRLGLTDTGRRRLEAARHELVDRLAPMLDDWGDNDIASLTTLMARLDTTVCRQLEQAYDAPTTQTLPTLPTYDLEPAQSQTPAHRTSSSTTEGHA